MKDSRSLLLQFFVLPYTLIGFLGESSQLKGEVEICKYVRSIQQIQPWKFVLILTQFSYLLSSVYLPVSCALRVTILLFLRMVRGTIAMASQDLSSLQPKTRCCKPWALFVFLLFLYCVVMTILKTLMDWYVDGGPSTAMSVSSRVVLFVDAIAGVCIDLAMLIYAWVVVRRLAPTKNRNAKLFTAFSVGLVAPMAALIRAIFVSMLKYHNAGANFDLLRTNIWTYVVNFPLSL